MNDLQVFQNDEFGQIRTVEINGEPWFVGKDIAQALGYSKERDAIAKHVDEDDATKHGITDSLGRVQQTTIINESGLYALIIGSRLPSAKQFKRWITSEVIPSIRKHGAYMTPATIDNIINDPDFGIRLLNELKEERQKRLALEAKNEEQNILIGKLQPKADYYDLVMSSKNTLTTTQVAADFGLSAVRFNQMLSAWKIQYKVNNQWILYQQYKDKGYVRSVARPIKTNGGYRFCAESTQWTQQGRLFLYELLKKNGILPVCERSVSND